MNCNAMTLGGMTCGYPLEPGIGCPNYAEHDDGSFESMDDQIERLQARVAELTEQRDRAREQRDELNREAAYQVSRSLIPFHLTDKD